MCKLRTSSTKLLKSQCISIEEQSPALNQNGDMQAEDEFDEIAEIGMHKYSAFIIIRPSHLREPERVFFLFPQTQEFIRFVVNRRINMKPRVSNR